MKKEYISPEFETVDLYGVLIMDSQNKEATKTAEDLFASLLEDPTTYQGEDDLD